MAFQPPSVPCGATLPEGFPDWTHTQHYVEVGSHSLNQECKDALRWFINAFFLCNVTQSISHLAVSNTRCTWDMPWIIQCFLIEFYSSQMYRKSNHGQKTALNTCSKCMSLTSDNLENIHILGYDWPIAFWIIKFVQPVKIFMQQLSSTKHVQWVNFHNFIPVMSYHKLLFWQTV